MPGAFSPVPGLGIPVPGRRAAFTLIELMVVLAIIAVLAVIGVPAFVKAFRKEPLRQAISDIMEVCGNARARAIMGGEPTEVLFKPQERVARVSGAGADTPAGTAQLSTAGIGGGGAFVTDLPRPGSGLSATWSGRLLLQMLDVNFVEYKDAETARVRFFANGTCDEMRLVLHSDDGEQRGVILDPITGLASMATADDIRGWLNQ